MTSLPICPIITFFRLILKSVFSDLPFWLPVASYSSHPGFVAGRRPPLPDYDTAATMAQLARRQQQPQHHQRSYSHDSAVYKGLSHISSSVANVASDYDVPLVEGKLLCKVELPGENYCKNMIMTDWFIRTKTSSYISIMSLVKV